jgi:hypothetical protein
MILALLGPSVWNDDRLIIRGEVPRALGVPSDLRRIWAQRDAVTIAVG